MLLSPLSHSSNAEAGPSRPTLAAPRPSQVREQEAWDDDFLFQRSASASPPHSPPPRNGRASPVPSFSSGGWTESEAEDPMTVEDDDKSSDGEGTETEGRGTTTASAAVQRADGSPAPPVDDMAMEGILTPDSSPGVELSSLSIGCLPKASGPWASSDPSSRPSLDAHTSFGSTSSSQRSFHPPANRSLYTPPATQSPPETLGPFYPRTSLEHLPNSPAPTDSSSSHSLSHLAGSGPVRRATDAFGSEASRASRPRARLRKRSRAGEGRLRDDSPNGRQEVDGEGSDGDAGASTADVAASPRHILSRGMTSIQKRLSSSTRPRPARSPSSLEVEKAALAPSDSANKARRNSLVDSKRSRRISIPPGLAVGTDTSSSSSYPLLSSSPDSTMQPSPAASFSSGHANAVPSQRPKSLSKGFHLPTRSSSVKVKADQSSTGLGMPPPKTSFFSPPSPRKSRPTSAQIPSRSMSYGSFIPAAGNSASSRATPQDQIVPPVFHPIARPTTPSSAAAAPIGRPTVTQRISSFGKKGAHRVTASISSIPTKASPTFNADVALPPPGPAPHGKSVKIERSNSNPSTHGLTRRNSLSDLRIPSRVASAQKALRERVGVVREFSKKIEDLKAMRDSHQSIHISLQESILHPQARKASSSSVGSSIMSPPAQTPQAEAASTAEALRGIDAQYERFWEVADILIGISSTGAMDDSDRKAEVDDDDDVSMRSSTASERTRAVTLTPGLQSPTLSGKNLSVPPLPLGPIAIPTPSPKRPSVTSQPSATPAKVSTGPPKASPERWRATTGRSDLSKRQVEILREMLTSPDPLDARSSAHHHLIGPASSSITLPVQTDSPFRSTGYLPSSGSYATIDEKRLKQQNPRRASRTGVKGLKDFLKSLKIGADLPSDQQPEGEGGRKLSQRFSQNTLSTMAGDQSFSSMATRKSPRRPSLASIFRFVSSSSSSSSNDLTGGSTTSDKSNARARSRTRSRVSQQPPSSASASQVNLGFGTPGHGPHEGSDTSWERMSVDENGQYAFSSASATSLHADSPTMDIGPLPLPSSSTTVSAASRSRTVTKANINGSSISLVAGDRTFGPSSSSASGSRSASATKVAYGLPPPPPLPSPASSSMFASTPTTVNSIMSGSIPPKSAPPGAQAPSDWPHGDSPPIPSTKAAASSTVKGKGREKGRGVQEGEDDRLELTPENLKPLLDRAKEVELKCGDCLLEMRALLGGGVAGLQGLRSG